ALIEEAAGLGRFKARRHRAELKLARVATQVDRARDLEEEVKKRLRPLALQATAAERAEKLRGELAKLRARIAALDLVTLEERTDRADAETEAGGPSVEMGELERNAPTASEAARVAAVEREARAERARQALARLLRAERDLGDETQAKLDELLVRRAAIETEL